VKPDALQRRRDSLASMHKPTISIAVALLAGGVAVHEADAQEAQPPPPGAYPPELVLRPLALPSGKLELGAIMLITDLPDDFSDSHLDFVYEDLLARVSLGDFEVRGRTRLFLDSSSEDAEGDMLQTVALGGRYYLHPDLALGVEAAIFDPTAEVTTTQVRGLVTHKARLSSAAALVLDAGLAYSTYSSDDDGVPAASDLVQLVAEGRLQVQVAPRFAAEYIVNLTGYLDAGEQTDFYPYALIVHGLHGVGTVTGHLDLLAGIDVTGGFELEIKTYTLGIQGRLP
jgi:hypothetical protein